jgi:hypothetical protein
MSRLAAVSFIAAACAAMLTGCPSGEDTADLYALRDTGPGGGLVFHVTDGGLHGLEAAPAGWYDGTSDPSAAWSNVVDALANGASPLPKAVGSGSANTDAIIAQAGHTASAAKLCRDYRGGGFDDWFLPSADELTLMWQSLQSEGLGGFTTGGPDYDYLSSSETSATVICNIYWADGVLYETDSKADPDFLRPARAF